MVRTQKKKRFRNALDGEDISEKICKKKIVIIVVVVDGEDRKKNWTKMEKKISFCP